MAAMFFQAKDWIASKVTPDCLKSSVEEVKNYAQSKTGGAHDECDPDDPRNKDKITEWEAGWNVTNAIQVSDFIFKKSLLKLLFFN